jgi:hypothetical protein
MSAAGANDFEVPWCRMTNESLPGRISNPMAGHREPSGLSEHRHRAADWDHAHRCFVASAVGSAAANNSRSHG